MKPGPFSERLSVAMIAAGEKCISLSAATGLSETHIRKLLSGERSNPTIRSVEKLANTLGVRPEWLAWGIYR